MQQLVKSGTGSAVLHLNGKIGARLLGKAGHTMDSEREKSITMQLLRCRFDGCMAQGYRAEAERIIELAWTLGYKYLAAQMVIAMEEGTPHK